MALNREQLLGSNNYKIEDVELDGLGTVRVKEMSARERGKFERYFSDKKGKAIPDRLQRVRELLVIYTVVDDNGQYMFTDKDVEALGDMPSSMVEKIAKVAQRLCSVSDDDIDELVGN